METVFGFKIWVVWDPNSRRPLSMRFATIEVHDINFAQEVVKQAIDNLGEYAKITSLAIDRGFTDGIFLWWLNTKDITFLIPAKANLDVYQDALSCIGTGNICKRDKMRTVGAGKNKIKVTDHWVVEGLEGLTSAKYQSGFYSSCISHNLCHGLDYSFQGLDGLTGQIRPKRQGYRN